MIRLFAILAALLSPFGVYYAFAGSGTVNITPGSGAVYDVTTDGSGNFVGRFGIWDYSAGANGAGVDTSHGLLVDPAVTATWALSPINGTSVPTNAIVTGCVYNSSPPTFTNGDAGAIQCTVQGYPIIQVTNTNANGQATAANSSPVVLPATQVAVGALSSTIPTTGMLIAGDAQNAEPTKATTGTLLDAFVDLVGKVVTSPYANRENMVRGAVSLTNTAATIIAAQGANVKIYGTDLTITRNDTSTSAITVTLNDSVNTPIDIPNNGGGGGYAHAFNVPLVWAANTAATCALSVTPVTTVHCSLTGFTGY